MRVIHTRTVVAVSLLDVHLQGQTRLNVCTEPRSSEIVSMYINILQFKY